MRRPHDFYETGQLAVDALVDCLGGSLQLADTIFEPCVGMGAISLPLIGRGLNVIGNDLHRPGCDYHFDAAVFGDWWQLPRIDWVITNPPFKQAFPILVNAHLAAKWGVAFLLRLSFLEPTLERGEWLEKHPPTDLVVLPRYSFTGDGKTDSVTCAWMIWKHSNPRGIRIVPKPPRSIEGV